MKKQSDGLEQLLVAQFNRDWKAFIHGTTEQLNNVRDRYNSLVMRYGTAVLDAAMNGEKTSIGAVIESLQIAKNGKTLRMSLTSRARAGSAEAVTLTKVASTITPTRASQRRRRAKTKTLKPGVGTFFVSFSDLKPIVLKIVTGLRDHAFTVKEVESVLKKDGVAYKKNHLHNILPRHLDGVGIVGKRDQGGKGPPVNLYKVVGKLALLDYKAAKKNDLARLLSKGKKAKS